MSAENSECRPGTEDVGRRTGRLITLLGSGTDGLFRRPGRDQLDRLVVRGLRVNIPSILLVSGHASEFIWLNQSKAMIITYRAAPMGVRVNRACINLQPETSFHPHCVPKRSGRSDMTHNRAGLC
jgi:hypothetical protein